MSKEYHEIYERCIEEAMYIIKNCATIRIAAENFKVSKSTVHTDMTKRLKNINSFLYSKVQMIININKNERHIRGGLATKKKYLLKSAKSPN